MRAEFLLNLHCINSCCHLYQRCQRCRFYAEGKTTDNTEAGEKRDSAVRKILCAATGEDKGKFQHEIHTAHNSMARPHPFVENTGCPPLCETAAHYGDNAAASRILIPQPLNLIHMSEMERVVFSDDADYLHDIPPRTS